MDRIGRVEITEILKHTPHRYPFVLLDRAVDGVPSHWIRVIKNVTGNEACITRRPGHQQSMPRLLLVEAFAQGCGVLCHFSGISKPNGQTLTFFAGIDRCRFYGDVLAGDQVVFECELKRAARGVVKFAGKGFVNDAVVIELETTAVLRDRDESAEGVRD
jgi:3-hydroxyacyl-[acyl-carrier-protein] dehydratase